MEPIVPVETTFRAVQRILTDPGRRQGPGAAHKWLGTMIVLYGICTDAKLMKPVGVQVGQAFHAINGEYPEETATDVRTFLAGIE